MTTSGTFASTLPKPEPSQRFLDDFFPDHALRADRHAAAFAYAKAKATREGQFVEEEEHVRVVQLSQPCTACCCSRAH